MDIRYGGRKVYVCVHLFIFLVVVSSLLFPLSFDMHMDGDGEIRGAMDFSVGIFLHSTNFISSS